MALFRLDERARAYFTASIANVLLTIALTVWLVVVEDEGARGLLLGNFGGIRGDPGRAASGCTARGWRSCRRRRSCARCCASACRRCRPSCRCTRSTSSTASCSCASSGLAEAGLYSLAVKFSQVVTVVVRAFNLAWPPLAYSIRDDDEARRTYALIVTYFLLLRRSRSCWRCRSRRAGSRARWRRPSSSSPTRRCRWSRPASTLYALYLVLVVVDRARRAHGVQLPGHRRPPRRSTSA